MIDSTSVPMVMKEQWSQVDGSYIFWATFNQALELLHYEPQRIVLVTSEPFTTKINQLVAGNSLLGLGAMALSVAAGIATANPALKVFVVMYDHDVLQDADQFLAIIQANHNITVLLVNNHFGQGLKGTSLLPLALPAEPTFLARCLVSDTTQLQNLIVSAAKHDGTAVIEIIEPLKTDQVHTYAWFRHQMQKVTPVSDLNQLYQMIGSSHEAISSGLLYRNSLSSYQSKLLKLQGKPLVDQPLDTFQLKTITIKPR